MRENNSNNPPYDYANGEIHFTTVNGRYCHRKPTKEVWQLLKQIHENNCVLKENELVALNRWLMGKDVELDFENVTSRQNRAVRFTDNLVNAIYYAHLR